MANSFNIVISAQDKATSVVRKINNEFSKSVRPLTDLHRSAAALGREIGRNPVAKGLAKVGRVAVGVAGSVAKIAAPMAAIVGVGSIAGVAALATEWGRLGFEVGKTSANLGMATSDLQSLRGAAELAGVSSETLTGGLKSLGDTMEDALFGRNQNAVLLLNKIGVGIHKTADGSIDAARGFKDIATYIASIKNAQVQGLVARQFGLEGALPLLRKGAAGIEEYQRKIADFGGVSTKAGIDAAEQFGLQLNYLSAAGNGLKIAIGSAILPVMQPMIEQFTKFISLNREAVGLKIGEWAQRLGQWLTETDFSKAGEEMLKIGRAIAYIVENIADLIAALSKLKTSPKKYFLGGVPRMLFDMLTDDPSKPGARESGGKIKPAGRAALPDDAVASNAQADAKARAEYANASPEEKKKIRAVTGLSFPDAPRGIRNNNPGNLRQWGNTARVDGYASFPTPEAGLAAMIKNLQLQQSKHGLNTISGIISKWAPPEENNTAAYIAAMEKQTGFKANQPLDLNDRKTVAPLVSGIIKQEGNSAGFSKSMIDEAVTRVVVDFKNAPAGTSATAKTKGGNMVPVRVNHSMPTLAAG